MAVRVHSRRHKIQIHWATSLDFGRRFVFYDRLYRQLQCLKFFRLFWGGVALILRRGRGKRLNSDVVYDLLLVLAWAFIDAEVLVLLVNAEPVSVFNLVYWDASLRDFSWRNAVQRSFELDSGRSPITLSNAKGSPLLGHALEFHLRTFFFYFWYAWILYELQVFVKLAEIAVREILFCWAEDLGKFGDFEVHFIFFLGFDINSWFFLNLGFCPVWSPCVLN